MLFAVLNKIIVVVSHYNVSWKNVENKFNNKKEPGKGEIKKIEGD